MRQTRNLTQRSIERAKPPKHKPQGQLWDASVRGLFVRVGRRQKTFAVEKMIKGVVYRHTIGPWPECSLENARDEARRRITHWKNHGGFGRSRNSIVLSDVFDDYIQARTSLRKLKPRTEASYREAFDRYFEHLHRLPIASINRNQIEDIWHNMSHIPAARHKAFSVLRALLNWAAKKGRIIDNPINVIADDIGQTREVALNRELRLNHSLFGQIMKLAREYSTPELSAWFECVAFTGIRNEQMRKLKWEEVDFEKRMFTFTDHKGAKNEDDWHIVPISDHLLEFLKRWKENSALRQLEPRRAAQVFPAKGAAGKFPYLMEPKRIVDYMEDELGFRPGAHQMRKFFETVGEEEGVSREHLDLLVGHTTTGLRRRYSFVRAKATRPTLDAVTSRLLALCNS